MHKIGDFIILAPGGDGNGISDTESTIVKIIKDQHVENFSYPPGLVKYLAKRREFGSTLMSRFFNYILAKPISLQNPEFIKIIETHTLVPELIPEFAVFMTKLLVAQFGDKILTKQSQAETITDTSHLLSAREDFLLHNIPVKDTSQQLGFINYRGFEIENN